MYNNDPLYQILITVHQYQEVIPSLYACCATGAAAGGNRKRRNPSTIERTNSGQTGSPAQPGSNAGTPQHQPDAGNAGESVWMLIAEPCSLLLLILTKFRLVLCSMVHATAQEVFANMPLRALSNAAYFLQFLQAWATGSQVGMGARWVRSPTTSAWITRALGARKGAWAMATWTT